MTVGAKRLWTARSPTGQVLTFRNFAELLDFAREDYYEPVLLTARQYDTAEFVAEHIYSHGWAPTVREIAAGIGVKSTNTVHQHLRALEGKGVVERPAYSPRAMRMLRPFARADAAARSGVCAGCAIRYNLRADGTVASHGSCIGAGCPPQADDG